MSKDIQLSDSDGVFLVKTARMAVTEFLSNGKKMKLESEYEEKFSFNSGVFVTLNNSDGLRGCIGFPMPDKKLSHGIIDAASGVEDISDQFTATTTSGVIHHIGANSDDDTLIVHLFGADDDGELKITLNKDIITPFDDGSYFVLINSEEVEFEQMGNTIHVEYDAGTDKIEIVGSHVVPEFGTIAMIVLAVAIVSIIAIAAKTKTALIPKL